MEVVFTFSVCFLLWIIGSFFIIKKATGVQALRRVVFLLLALVGIGLLVAKPQQRIAVDPEVVHIVPDESEVDIIESETSFEYVHDFLSSNIVDRTTEVHIHGLGLAKEELELLDGRRIVFHPSPMISGITQLSVPLITEREELILQGTYQGEDVKRIYMLAADRKIREATIQDSTFLITSKAPVAGSYLFELNTILTSNDTLRELLPIEVAHEPSWQMLVLSSYPSFEINYLKNYWTSLGNGFSLRSKISKEKFHTSFINSKRRDFDVLTRNVVSAYDFIITDSPTWNQLSLSEQSNIKRAVSNSGLALIIRPSSIDVTVNNLQIPKWSEPKEIMWKTTSDDVMLNLYNISSSWRTTRQQGYDLARYRSSGLGHIAVLGIDKTYKLILTDNEEYYQTLWSTIFSDLYRDFSPTSKLLHNQWIWEGEKNYISILSNHEIDTPPLLNDSIPLPYIQVPFLNNVTEVSLWPSQGYNKISLEDGKAALKLYAHKKDAWQAVKQSQLLSMNMHAAMSSDMLPIPVYYEDHPISKFWWYALVLLGFGALWLDERLFA